MVDIPEDIFVWCCHEKKWHASHARWRGGSWITDYYSLISNRETRDDVITDLANFSYSQKDRHYYRRHAPPLVGI